MSLAISSLYSRLLFGSIISSLQGSQTFLKNFLICPKRQKLIEQKRNIKTAKENFGQKSVATIITQINK